MNDSSLVSPVKLQIEIEVSQVGATTTNFEVKGRRSELVIGNGGFPTPHYAPISREQLTEIVCAVAHYLSKGKEGESLPLVVQDAVFGRV